MEYVHSQLLEGKVTLFLGAGASYNCCNLEGTRVGFSGSDLIELISNKFLGGTKEAFTLDALATLAIRKVGRKSFDLFLKNLVENFESTEEHYLITKYKWKSIYTTNYDQVIENTYHDIRKESDYRVEKVLSDDDPINSFIIEPNVIPLLKLHGCISRINDKSLPLVISRASYRHVLENRSALFQMLMEDLSSNVVIFYGYGLDDLNIIGLIEDLDRNGSNRPRHIWLDPYMSDLKKEYWSSNNMDCRQQTLTQFLEEIPNEDQLLKSVARADSIISHIIPSHERPSPELELYLNEQLNYIRQTNSHENYNNTLFYMGSSNGFDWLFNDLDFERTVFSEINELIYIDSEITSNKFNFYLINGYAGSGKTVLLKRLAWQGIIVHNKPCFYLVEGGHLDIDMVIELIDLVQEPLYLFLENVLGMQSDIEKIYDYCTKKEFTIYIIGEARTNEWNNDSNRLDRIVEHYFDLRDLDNKEISKLIENLNNTSTSGNYNIMSDHDKFNFIKRNNNKQLLVTLLELTHNGKEFSDIINDEYKGIYDRVAKELYLNICTLHQYGVEVRAGMVNRLSGIDFNKFKDDFLLPLELLIVSFYSHRVNDYVYTTRHQNIAGQVYLQAFMSETEKAQHLIKIVRFLNIAYREDKYALERILRGKALSEQFNNKELVYQIYGIAFDAGINKSFILHQKAVFEMNHNVPNLNLALEHIDNIDNEDSFYETKIVNHTKANLYRKLALVSRDIEEKKRLWSLGIKLLNKNLAGRNINSKNHDTKGRILLDEIRCLSSLDNTTVDVINDFESNLNDGYKKFPYDESLTTLEYDFSKTLDDVPTAIGKLEQVLLKNNDSKFVLQRYAKFYIEREQTQVARDSILKYLKNYPSDKDINYLMAYSYIKENEKDNIEIIVNYLKKSYSPNDSFYMRRFEHAKLEYLYGDEKTAKKLFDDLKDSSVPSKIKNKFREGGRNVYSATVVTINGTYGFVNCTSFSENMYMSMSCTNEEVWELLSRRDRVNVTLCFTFKGPRIDKLTLR